MFPGSAFYQWDVLYLNAVDLQRSSHTVKGQARQKLLCFLLRNKTGKCTKVIFWKRARTFPFFCKMYWRTSKQTFFLPRQAVGLGAPQTINGRPLPSPDALYPDTHDLWTQQFLEMHVHDTIGRATGTNRLLALWDHDLEEKAWSRVACVVDNVFINFIHRSPKTFRFFFLFETFVYRFPLLSWSNDLMWRTCCWRTISIWDDQM